MLGHTFQQPAPLGVRCRLPGSSILVNCPHPAGTKIPEKLPAFTNIPRMDLYRTVEERVRNPSKIHQGATTLCAAASLMYITAKLRAGQYAKFVKDLYENGKAKLGDLEITPGEGCKNFNPSGKIASADWVALASIRDSENMILTYDDPGDDLAGRTMPSALAGWLEKSGFRDVVNDTNLYFTKGVDCLKHADQLFRNGYQVCLFTNAAGLSAKPEIRGDIAQTVSFPNHWIVLTSMIEIAEKSVNFTVYTWGKEDRRVPFVPMKESSLEMWLQNFYGFIAGK